MKKIFPLINDHLWTLTTFSGPDMNCLKSKNIDINSIEKNLLPGNSFGENNLIENYNFLGEEGTVEGDEQLQSFLHSVNFL